MLVCSVLYLFEFEGLVVVIEKSGIYVVLFMMSDFCEIFEMWLVLESIVVFFVVRLGVMLGFCEVVGKMWELIDWDVVDIMFE